MNATPIQPDSNEVEELARLLPVPAERALPSDRHRRLQEFVMSQIHQDLRSAQQSPRPSPKRRRVLITSALTTATAIAAVVAVVIGAGGFGGSTGGSDSPVVTTGSGQQILLAAAATAARAPEGSGAYWHVTVKAERSAPQQSYQWEEWYQRDGQSWYKSAKGGPVKLPTSFDVGSPVSFDQLQQLPTEPAELKAWITDHVANSDAKKLSETVVFDALISLVCLLPAPPAVRAAAFRAIASYPNVTSLGAVDGGQGLEIAMPKRTSRVVIDPATSRVHRTNFFVPIAGGARYFTGDAAEFFTFTTEWTNVPPA